MRVRGMKINNFLDLPPYYYLSFLLFIIHSYNKLWYLKQLQKLINKMKDNSVEKFLSVEGQSLCELK